MRSDHHLLLARSAVKAALEDLPPSAPIGVGCSGGRDSLALLAALKILYTGHRSSLVHVLIVDHGLQEITHEVARQVASLAASYGFTPHLLPVKVDPSSAGGLEAAAREARYAAFEAVAQQEELQSILLGHTMTDQAEQVLLSLLRGSGVKTIGGMLPHRGLYRRPFLETLRRQDTAKVCREASLTPWDDPHNQEPRFRRVVARGLVETLSTSLGQDLTKNLCRTASLAREDAEALDDQAREFFLLLQEESFPVEQYLLKPPAVRKRALRLLLLQEGVPAEGITHDVLQRGDALASSWRGQGAIPLKGGGYLLRREDHLEVAKSLAGKG